MYTNVPFLYVLLHVLVFVVLFAYFHPDEAELYQPKSLDDDESLIKKNSTTSKAYIIACTQPFKIIQCG